MKILLRAASSVSALLALLVFAATGTARAQSVHDFVIENFDASYTLTNEDPQGKLTIIEKIKVDFSGTNHGISRAIPDKYDDELNLEVVSVKRDGAAEPYIMYTQSDNSVLRIGDPNKTITGEHTYAIEYTVENVIRFYDEYDELYWDINGDQWLQSFDKVSVQVVTGAKIVEPGVKCYTGSFGSSGEDCAPRQDVNSLQVETTRAMGPYETLTVVAAFEKGYFTPKPWWEMYTFVLYATPLIMLQAYVLRMAYKKWLQYGKDYKKRGITVPYYGRPKGLSVMQAGYIKDNSLTARHITGSIIDLAIRGYIKITEEKKRFGGVKHQLTLLKLPDDKLTNDESMLLSNLFLSLTIGSSFKLEDKKNKLYKIVEKLKTDIDTATIKAGYYELSPKKSFSKIGLQFGLALLLMLVGLGMAEATKGLTAVSGIAAFLAVLIFAALMTKRSREGAMVVEHMDGLKLYVDVAEKDRIKAQDAVEAPLSPHSGEPIRDVAFFEKLLPFAVAMGVEKSWAGAFADIYTQPPDWYSGNWNTFSTAALASSLAKTAMATNSSFASPSSSGGSGFSSGGGFSGGGGGGGGGGGW